MNPAAIRRTFMNLHRGRLAFRKDPGPDAFRQEPEDLDGDPGRAALLCERLGLAWGCPPLVAALWLTGARKGPPGPARPPGPEDLDPDHSDLRARGLAKACCLDREIGLVGPPGAAFSGWLAVTVFDVAGRRAGRTYRRVESEIRSAPVRRPNWAVPSTFPGGRHLYNLDRAWPSLIASDTAILVEGPFDALHLHRQGWSNTVALLGNRLTGWHAELLTMVGVRRVVLLLDNDHGGRQGRRWALHDDGRLDGFEVTDLTPALPPGSDPDDLGPAPLADLLSRFRPPASAGQSLFGF